MHVRIAKRFPARIVHIQLEFPLTVMVTDGPEGNRPSQNLWQHKGGGGVCRYCAVGKKLALQMHRGLASIHKANIDERLAVRVAERGVHQTRVESQRGISPVDLQGCGEWGKTSDPG